MSKSERDLYPKIENWLNQYLKDKYKNHSVITTHDSSRKYLNKILKKNEIHCKEAEGIKIKVDILGILKRGNDHKLVFVEVKNSKLTLKDLGQLWGYTKLINPEESFLISPGGFGELSYIFDVLNRIDLLEYGLKKKKYMKIAKWDKRYNSIDYSNFITP